jgi:RNA polymerase sigma-54 factor
MRQSPQIQLRVSQQLTMTPQLQQAIRLLQLSSVDLQTEIQNALESNMMLERIEESQEILAPADTALGTAASGLAETPAAEMELDAAHTTLPDELPVDSAWEDVYDSYDGATSFSRNAEEQRDIYEQQASVADSLRDHLLWQMQLTPFSENDAAIATALIDAIDDTGYLSVSLEELHQGLQTELGVDLDEVEVVLHRLQHFDPPGVAARNPAECLLLQLNQLPPDTPCLPQARELVQQHLDLLAEHNFSLLARRLKVSREALQPIVLLILSLNPHPGSQLSTTKPQYLIPDVFVYRHNHTWRVELNPDNAPRLRINSQYAQLVRRADNSTDNLYLKNHLQEARWFLKSLKNRNYTLLKVATCIVECQRDFLEYGEEYMKPLVLRDIAKTMDIHESTISRVTTQKYMHTPRGIYEFKYFFSSHVDTSDGGECSSTAIRAMIKKLIAEENPQKPLSDSMIAKLLGQEGIQVARRTVAKYRETMSIPASTERKRIA